MLNSTTLIEILFIKRHHKENGNKPQTICNMHKFNKGLISIKYILTNSYELTGERQTPHATKQK